MERLLVALVLLYGYFWTALYLSYAHGVEKK